MSLELVLWVGRRVVGRTLKLLVPFWGDCCWEVQMRKNGMAIKRRNSFEMDKTIGTPNLTSWAEMP